MITPGLFGENLTVSELESAEYNIGDIFHIGDVVLQVTKPRNPCSTLAAKIGDPTFVKIFRLAGRPGLYCRVLQTGEITAGDTVTVEKYQGDTVSIPEMVENYYHPDKSEAGLRRFLAAPISIRDREALEGILAKAKPE